MTLTVALCARLHTDDGRHACERAPGHEGDCACRCDPCVDRADRLAAY